MKRMKIALFSVHDKSDLKTFGPLLGAGWEFWGTLETYAVFNRELGLGCRLLDAETGLASPLFQQISAIHPKVAGGIITNASDPQHVSEMAGHKIQPIDLVVVNLSSVAMSTGTDSFEVSRLTLILLAVSNLKSATIIVDPADYKRSVLELQDDSGPSSSFRYEMAVKAMECVSSHDQALVNRMKSSTLRH
jgi:AICAR transformylase/IMP cyclohydrolase PurH